MKQTQEEKLAELQSKIRDFFEYRGLPVQLKGENWKPIIILDNGLVMHGISVDGFTLVFKDDLEEELERVKLNMNIRTFPTEDLIALIQRTDKEPGYRLKSSETGLFVVGWQKREGRFMPKDKRFPLFGIHKPLVMPEEVAQTLAGMTDNVEIDKYQNDLLQ